MHVLFLTTEFPWPPHGGGRARTLGQLEVLSSLDRVSEIRLVSVCERPVGEEERVACAAALPKLRIEPPVPHPVHLWRSPRHVPRTLFERVRMPYLAAKWRSPKLTATVRRLLRTRTWDLLYVDHLGMASHMAALDDKAPTRIVLDAHNVESDIFRAFAELQRGLLRSVAELESRAARAFESRALKRADATVAISEEDASRLRALGGEVQVVSPFVRLPETRTDSSQCAVMLFVGSLGWHPNVRGLDWFIERVWPQLRQRRADVRLRVVGTGAHSLRRWRSPGVELVGPAADVQCHYREARVFIAPAFGGSGVRMKILHAMTAGLPVVTTAAGAAGLPVRSGEELYASDDPSTFAAHCLELLSDAAARAHLRSAADAFLRRRHSFSVARAQMEEVLSRV